MVRATTLTQRFDDARSDYNGAKQNRHTKKRILPPLGTGSDYHFRNDAERLRLIETARDMKRNDDVIGPLIRTAVINTIKTGFDPQPQTGDKELNKALYERFWDTAVDPRKVDISRTFNFSQLERLAFEQSLVDGDDLTILNPAGPLEYFEAHRCRSPQTKLNVVHGVLLDPATRQRKQYWFTKEDVNPSRQASRVGEYDKVDTWNEHDELQVCHVFHPDRFTQTRGVSAMHPIIIRGGMVDDVEFATLLKAQLASSYVFIHERDEDDFTAAGDAPPSMGLERTTESNADGSTKHIDSVSPGMGIYARRGEKITGFSPNIPNPEYFPHIKHLLRILGINLGIPLVMYMMDAEETNFSGYRGALDQARAGFQVNQLEFMAQWHVPIWRHWVRIWSRGKDALGKMLRAAQVKGLNIYAHHWIPPAWPYIEPLKDAQADSHQLQHTLNSPRRLQSARGRNWEEVATETVEDYAFAIELAKTRAAEINKKFPDDVPVHWRELINLPQPQGANFQFNQMADDNDKEDSDASADKRTGRRVKPAA